jgi:hypothetical protein
MWRVKPRTSLIHISLEAGRGKIRPRSLAVVIRLVVSGKNVDELIHWKYMVRANDDHNAGVQPSGYRKGGSNGNQ